MKDAKGHGSDSRGGSTTPSFLDPHDPRRGPVSGAQLPPAHSQGVQQIGKPVDMQRRQYEAIAGAISRFPDAGAKGDLATHFADALSGTNPNFNAGKFKNAAMTGNMGRTQNKAPGMQSRHYEAVAGAIASLPSSMRSPVASHFAGDLGGRNPNFNKQRFLKAAGG